MTFSFYPGTQPLNVQGYKQEIIRKKLMDCLSKDDQENSTSDVTVNVDSSHANQNDDPITVDENSSDEEEDGCKEDGSSSEEDTDECTEGDFNAIHRKKQHNNKCVCHYSDLVERIAALETKVFINNEKSPTYLLVAKVRNLEEERNSLLTALRMLREEAGNSFITSKNTETISPPSIVADNLKERKVDSKRKSQPVRNGKSESAFKSVISNGNSKIDSANHSLAVVGDSTTRDFIGAKLSKDHNAS